MFFKFVYIKDLELLKLIRAYFGVGVIIQSTTSEMCVFKVNSLEQILTKILPHFDKYPLITQKFADYILFKEIIVIMSQKKHLIKQGLQALINIRASLNLGLSESLKIAFPNTIPVSRPYQSLQEIPNPE